MKNASIFKALTSKQWICFFPESKGFSNGYKDHWCHPKMDDSWKEE